MSKSQTRCVFCGGAPVTKGHIWPEWLGKYLPTGVTHHQSGVGEILTFESKAEGPIPKSRIRQGRAGSRKPRNTCLNCNGGWMSRLEQANIAALSKLIKGEPILLDTISQRLLASLLCLITIRVEFTDRQMQAVPADDRKILMTFGHPPLDTWRIWIANYSGAAPEDHWSRHFGMQVVSSPDQAFRPHKCNAQVTTMVFGKLCAHVVSSTVMPVPSGYHGIRLSALWPPHQLEIDSRYLGQLSDDDVIHLHEALPASIEAIE